jgi:hypothetical protein
MRTKGENKHQGCETNCNPLDTNYGFTLGVKSQPSQLPGSGAVEIHRGDNRRPPVRNFVHGTI